MAGERHGVASWPGAIAVASCSYTVSHGITPGTAILRILPQADYPSEHGTLVIDDGVGSITLPSAKIDDLTVQQDEGFIWSLSIVDRRWKWRDLGRISGAYNQLDPHSKLIPWTIRSPVELAKLCLEAMGETGYVIDLPPGLTKDVGEKFAGVNPPWIGVNPVTGTNPPVNWDNEVPAVALQNLCEQFGRRVIYQLSTDSVLIAIPGRGNALPDGSISSRSPSITAPERPAGVGVVGLPTKYQARFLLEAVGEEWDGSYRPINELSYAPRVGEAVQINKATAAATGSNTFNIIIGLDGFAQVVTFSTTTANASTAVANLAAAINASQDPRVKGVLTASAAGDELTVTGVKKGEAFFIWATVDLPVTNTASFNDELIQAPSFGRVDWRYSGPPLFPGVRATDRLTFQDALRLAQGSVFQCYRLADVGVAGNGPIKVPGYGPLKRRQQVLLLPTKVDQVVPQPVDPQLRNPQNQVIILNFYNGYSRDMPAVCYGSTAKLKSVGGAFAWWTPALAQAGQNTDDDQQIYIDFRIDPEQQIVTFSRCVFRTEGGGIFAATPILETGVHIRNAKTNELEAYQTARRLASGDDSTNFAWRRYQDVQLFITTEYGQNNEVKRVRLLEADAVVRANYYLDGIAAQYLTAAGLTNDYNGIVPIDLDGAISQVSWSVGEGGSSTIASVNTEHSLYVPPYPARRRAEFLRPAQQAALRAPDRVNMINPWVQGYAPFPILGS